MKIMKRFHLFDLMEGYVHLLMVSFQQMIQKLSKEWNKLKTSSQGLLRNMYLNNLHLSNYRTLFIIICFVLCLFLLPGTAK